MNQTAFTDQRTVSDRDFCRQLTLPGSAGTALTTAVKQKKLPAVHRIIAEHFRTRVKPVWPFYMHGTPWLQINGRGTVMEKADNLLCNKVTSSWPPFKAVDINNTDGSLNWNLRKSKPARNTFIPELTTAFNQTGNPEYLLKAKELLFSFADAHPFILEKGFFEDQDRYFGGRFNEGLSLTYRMLRWIDLLYSGSLQINGIFSDKEVFRLIKLLWFYAIQFNRLTDHELRRDNHHLVDHGQAPYVMGMMFQEFSLSKKLTAAGKRVIRHHCRENIFPDGSYAEHSMQYQYHILFHYLHPLAMAQANAKHLLDPPQEKLLIKWLKFNTDACRPDGTLCDFGDGRRIMLHHLFDTLGGYLIKGETRKRVQALGYQSGRTYYRTAQQLHQELDGWQPGNAPQIGISQFYSKSGPAAVEPSPLPAKAALYPNGGYSMFRQNWSVQADYLAVSHFTDSMPHGHTHWDPMSFILYTGGQTLIGEPAAALYEATSQKLNTPEEAQCQRGYLYNMQSHNCLVMDDDTLKPLKAMGHRCFWGGSPPQHKHGIFKSGGPIEVLETSHLAYAPTCHRRFIFHIRNLGFLNIDLLSRPAIDYRPRQYTQLLHLDWGVQSGKAIDGRSIRIHKGKAASHIIPGLEAESSWLKQTDERLEELNDRGTMLKAPDILELTRVIEGPSVFTTYYIPDRFKGKPQLQYLGNNPAKSDFKQHDGFSAHKLDLGSAGTILTASCPYGKELNSKELKTDAEAAVIVKDAQGKIRSWCAVNCSYLIAGRKALLKGRKKKWSTG